MSVAAMAALGMTAATMPAHQLYRSGASVPEGQPWRGSAGMAYGTKVRGTAAVKRAALKARRRKAAKRR